MSAKNHAALARLTQATHQAVAAVSTNRAEAERLVTFVRDRMGEIAAAFYDIGQVLAKLRDRALYSALGHDSFDALLAKMSFSKAQAYRFIGIAQKMSRERASELGPRRAIALLRLTAATPGEDTVDQVLRKGVTLPGRKERLPLQKLTAEQIEDAARTIARAHKPAAQRVPAGAHEAALERADALRERLHEAGHEAARVTIQRRGRRGEREVLMLRIDVPVAGWEALAAALNTRAKRK